MFIVWNVPTGISWSQFRKSFPGGASAFSRIIATLKLKISTFPLKYDRCYPDRYSLFHILVVQRTEFLRISGSMKTAKKIVKLPQSFTQVQS